MKPLSKTSAKYGKLAHLMMDALSHARFPVVGRQKQAFNRMGNSVK